MHLSRARFLLPLLAALLLNACSATTEILRGSDEAIPTRPARTLVIAGVTDDDDLRRRYEQVFVTQLRKAGLDGVGSHTLFASTQGMTMSELRQKMHAASVVADAVLHVQLVALTGTPVLSPTDVPAEQAPAHRDIGGISVAINPPADGGVSGTRYDVVLQATLYELPQRTLLWTVNTSTREANDLEAVARSHAKALIRAMRARGYLASGR